MLTVFFCDTWGVGDGRMPEFLAYREQILHSPPVLPASLQCKLGSNSEGIAYFTQNWLASWGKRLHSLPTENWSYIHRQFCYLAPLRLTQNWLVNWDKCLNSLPTENWFCIHLPFCTLCYQNRLEICGKCLHFLPTENWFCIRLQFCYLAPLGFTQNWLVDWGECLNFLPTEN